MRNFMKEAMLYSMRMWFFLLLMMLPMIAFVGLTEFLAFGLITRFNLFMLFLAITLGLTSPLSSLISSPVPKIEMKSWQWKFAIELLAWLKRHELIAFSMSLLGLLMIFIPLTALWSWMVSMGIISSGISAFIYLILLLLPFFIIPCSIFIVAHESIVNPEKPSLSQIGKIVERIYALNQLAGEGLERAKKTWITIPSGKTKIIAVSMLMMLITMLIVLQLVELKFLSQGAVVFVQFLMIVESIAVVCVYASTSLFGEKKTQLDILLESEDEKIGVERSKVTKKFKSFVERIPDAIEKILDRIEKSMWYKLIAVLGVMLGLFASILRLMGFV